MAFRMVKLYTILDVAGFAILGSLLRGSLEYGFSFAPSARPALYDDLPANMLGCFLWGWLSHSRLGASRRLKKGLTTGFCGSLTTFSSWMTATTLAFLECRDETWCILIGIYQLASTWAVCDLAHRGGVLLAEWTCTRNLIPNLVGEEKIAAPRPTWEAFIFPTTLLIGAIIWFSVTQASMAAALLWAPLGASIRLFLHDFAGKPGTLVANWIGTFFSCIALIMWRSALSLSGDPIANFHPMPVPAFSALAASLSVGLAGSISTLSTFMHEARHEFEATENHRALFYVVVSIIGGQIISFSLLTWLYY